MKTKLIHLCICILFAHALSAQVVYFTTSTGSTTPNQIMLFKLDLATCTICPILSQTIGPWSTVCVLPNGDLMVSSNFDTGSSFTGTVTRYTLPNMTATATLPGPWMASVTAPNGTIYVSRATPSHSEFLSFNPATNTTTLIGSMPAGQFIQTLYVYNGVVHGLVYDGSVPSTTVMQINLTNPAASVPALYQNYQYSNISNLSTGGLFTTDGGVFFTYDYPTNVSTSICPQYTVPGPAQFGLAGVPAGAPVAPCVCLTSSAGIPNAPAVNLCPPATATIGFSGLQLDFNDDDNYILYTNLANPTGSVLFQNGTGVFPFVSPLVQGTTYYVACVVGDAVAGVVDLTDPCLDISNPTQLLWRPIPQVATLTSTNTSLCAGECRNVELTITGTPPYAVGWQWQQGGAAVGLTNVLFNQQNPITFQACAPASAIGPLQMVICGITDAFCSNQP
jgi:hypothetical protein